MRGLTLSLMIAVALSAGSSVLLQQAAPLQAQNNQADNQNSEEDSRALLEEVLDSMISGQYRAAKRSAGKLNDVPAVADAAQWLEARIVSHTDSPADVIKLLKKAEASASTSINVRSEYVRAMLHAGELADGLKEATDLQQAHPTDPRSHMLAGEIHYQLGDHEAANSAFSNARKVAAAIPSASRDQRDDLAGYLRAEQLTAAGWAAYRQNDLASALASYERAEEHHRYHTPSILEIARLFSETSKVSEARTNYVERITGSPTQTGFNPNSAEAQVMLARCATLQYRGDQARRALDTALRINRDNPEARAMRAKALIDLGRYDDALKDLKALEKINPRLTEGRAVRAFFLWKRDSAEALNAWLDESLHLNPKNGELFELLGNAMTECLRFPEAIAWYRRGIELAPERWTLHAALGQALLYTGDFKQGQEYLQTALDKDTVRNSLATRNQLLFLTQRYPGFKESSILEGRVDLLLPADEASALELLYEDELRRGVDELTAKYQGRHPEFPIRVEAFHRKDDFDVRNIGFPGLGALGTCYGRLVTLLSPSLSGAEIMEGRTFNWASTLRHELDHAYQLHISKGQAPHWLAEGCSVAEEARARPEWRRHAEDRLYQAFISKGLPEISDFERWFQGERGDVLFAYYLAGLMVEMIERDLGGQSAIISMLEGFGKHKTQAEIFQQMLGISEAEFDKRFHAQVEAMVAPIKLMQAVSTDNIIDLREQAEDGEASTDQLVQLARGLLQLGQRTDARIWANLAAKRGADSAEFDYVLGQLTTDDPRLNATERARESRRLLEQAVNRGLEDYNLYMTLAGAAQRRQDVDSMIFFANLARRAFPTNPAPLGLLFQMYVNENNTTRALDVAEQYTRLSEDNESIRMWLLGQYHENGADYEIVEMSQQLIYISPFALAPYRAQAKAMTQLGQFDQALRTWEIMRRLAFKQQTPEQRATLEIEARIGKARTLLAAGKRDDALLEAAGASSINAEHPLVRGFNSEQGAQETPQRY